MRLQESGEMYLEHILTLREEKGVVRAIDVAALSGYSKPSVSRALGLLKNAGYITVEEKSGSILLTERGEGLAHKIAERHKTLMDFLLHVGVEECVAEADACKIEHVISDETYEAIHNHMQNMDQ